MNFLDNITPEQRKIIVSLPYRVGLWVSRSDVAGGEEANENELGALSRIIHGYTEDFFGSETVQYIMSETVANKDQWDTLSDNLSTVAEDCRSAIDVLSTHVDKKDVTSFKMHLMEIAEAVALAFREDEYNIDSKFGKLRAYIAYYMFTLKRSKDITRRKSFEEYLNISTDERKTLGALAEALGTTY